MQGVVSAAGKTDLVWNDQDPSSFYTTVEQPLQISHIIDVLTEVLADPKNKGKVKTINVARLMVDPSSSNFYLRSDGRNHNRESLLVRILYVLSRFTHAGLHSRSISRRSYLAKWSLILPM